VAKPRPRRPAAAPPGSGLVDVLERAGRRRRRARRHAGAVAGAQVGGSGGRRRCRLPPPLRRLPPRGRRAPAPRAARRPARQRRGRVLARRFGRRRGRPALRGHVLPRSPEESIPSFREVWAGLGDSIVVVGGDGLWNCHIHTDDIGAAIEAAIEVGRPRRIRVSDLWNRSRRSGGCETPARRRRAGDAELPVKCASWPCAPATGYGASSGP